MGDFSNMKLTKEQRAEAVKIAQDYDVEELAHAVVALQAEANDTAALRAEVKRLKEEVARWKEAARLPLTRPFMEGR